MARRGAGSKPLDAGGEARERPEAAVPERRALRLGAGAAHASERPAADAPGRQADPELELGLAQRALEAWRPDDAVRSLRALIERAPEGASHRVEALERLGRLLAGTDPQQAAEAFARAHAEGQNPLMLRDAVIAYTNAGAVDEAYELLRERLLVAEPGGSSEAGNGGRS